ncbi:MAG: LysM peptidoglycan-binding domain-containing protein [Anaerolineaceae bacterium]|nr:LysM peptidoglycan-binding domain-containing protein [Anaerolineaceae bacterium]
MKSDKKYSPFIFGFLILILFILLSCNIPYPETTWSTPTTMSSVNDLATQIYSPSQSITSELSQPVQTPTKDLDHSIPLLRSQSTEYTIRKGDTLKSIARHFLVDLLSLKKINQIEESDTLLVGEILTIPPSLASSVAPNNKVIPDSELVLSPSSINLESDPFSISNNSFLLSYSQEVGGEILNGMEIVTRISRNFSVNPRLLLAILEHKGNWISESELTEEKINYPITSRIEWRKGLYLQLGWTADTLNNGYYLWKVNALPGFLTDDGKVIQASTEINAGTAGIQYLFSILDNQAQWHKDISQVGFMKTYQSIFGSAFQYSLDPLVPIDLNQPPMQLPFQDNISWSFTGGPHGGWGSGSAWAALDFAPPSDAAGCVPNDAWITAVSDGLIIESGNGRVVQDLDGDGFVQTGWTVLYLHVANKHRIENGVYVNSGDPIGHPSCEGGVSSGTHVHVARRYNGEWIPADGDLPFNLDGWLSEGYSVEYNGALRKGDKIVEAWGTKNEFNQIQR